MQLCLFSLRYCRVYICLGKLPSQLQTLWMQSFSCSGPSEWLIWIPVGISQVSFILQILAWSDRQSSSEVSGDLAVIVARCFTTFHNLGKGRWFSTTGFRKSFKSSSHAVTRTCFWLPMPSVTVGLWSPSVLCHYVRHHTASQGENNMTFGAVFFCCF